MGYISGSCSYPNPHLYWSFSSFPSSSQRTWFGVTERVILQVLIFGSCGYDHGHPRGLRHNIVSDD